MNGISSVPAPTIEDLYIQLSVGKNSCSFTELEDAITRLQPQWLGEENSRAWNKANEHEFFPTESGI